MQSYFGGKGKKGRGTALGKNSGEWERDRKWEKAEKNRRGVTQKRCWDADETIMEMMLGIMMEIMMEC